MVRSRPKNSISSAGQGSAPVMRHRRCGSSTFGTVASTDAGMSRWEIRLPSSSAASSAPVVVRCGTTRHPPESSAMHRSATDTSKLGETNWYTRLSPRTP